MYTKTLNMGLLTDYLRLPPPILKRPLAMPRTREPTKITSGAVRMILPVITVIAALRPLEKNVETSVHTVASPPPSMVQFLLP